MERKISYSAAGFEDRDVEAALDAIAAAGFRYTELFGREPHIPAPLTGATLAGFNRRVRERGLSIPTIHAPLDRTVLGAPEEAWRQEKVGVLASFLRFARDVGASNMVIHPVPNPKFVPDADHPETPARISDAVRRSLDDLAPIAQEAGVRMLLENLPLQCGYPYVTMTELRPLADQYPKETVGWSWIRVMPGCWEI